MSIKNDDPKPVDNMKLLKQETPVCGPGCGCQGARPAKRIRLILGAVILVAAAALAARAVMRNNVVAADKAVSGFATGQATGQLSVSAGDISSVTNDAPASADTVAGREISALSELNTVAADTNAVFVFLPDKEGTSRAAPTAQIRGAARTIESQARIKIGIFTLGTSSRDYDQIAAQMTVPGVLAMVKGRGMVPVTGDITETKLIQGFVAASSAGGCGPAAKSGCCPR